LVLNAQKNQTRFQKGLASSVGIFGEVLADIFPDASVLGGAPYNVARHLRAFGLNPLLISRTGNDRLQQELLGDMARLGMDASGIQSDPLYPTGQVQVHMQGSEHRFDILADQAYDHIHSGVTHLITMALKPDVVYFGTLVQRSTTSRLALDSFLNDAGSPRFLDINLRAPWYDKHIIRRSLLRADMLKLNDQELAILADLLRLPGKTAQEQVITLIQRFKLESVVVTCGMYGAWLINRDQEHFSAPGHPVGNGVADSVGAGDGFAAVYLLGTLLNWPADILLARANQFAAAICRIRGAAPTSADFYTPFLLEWDG